MLISDKIALAINEQIGHEFGNANQYLAIANYFEAEALFGLAKIYYTQAEEEREHGDEVRQVPARRRGQAGHPGDPRARNEFESADDAAQLASTRS